MNTENTLNTDEIAKDRNVERRKYIQITISAPFLSEILLTTQVSLLLIIAVVFVRQALTGITPAKEKTTHRRHTIRRRQEWNMFCYNIQSIYNFMMQNILMAREGNDLTRNPVQLGNKSERTTMS